MSRVPWYRVGCGVAGRLSTAPAQPFFQQTSEQFLQRHPDMFQADPGAGLDEAFRRLIVNNTQNDHLFASCGYETEGIREWYMGNDGM